LSPNIGSRAPLGVSRTSSMPKPLFALTTIRLSGWMTTPYHDA
jgi:hypothetical protein